MIKTTQRRIALVPAEAEVGMFVELDKLLSQSNYKLYRQGMNYHARVSVQNGQELVTGRSYRIFTLPTDHRTIGALRMARAIYNQAVKDELEIRPEVKTPWTDFKIETYGPAQDAGADTMYTNQAVAKRTGAFPDGVTTNLKLTSDSYNISEITSNAGNQKRFSLIDTGDTTHWNVFTEYRNYLTNRADPDSANEVPAYGDASAVLTEMAELADKGDEPPYSWDFTQALLDGTQQGGAVLNLQLQGVITSDNFPAQPKSVTFEAPLGLIFIKSDDALDATSPQLMVEALPGNYKGVKADKLYPMDKLLGF